MRWIKTALELFSLQSQIKLQQLMQYRTDFTIGLLMALSFSAIGPLFQFLIYTQTKGYPGWNLNQILLFQGILLLSSGIQSTFFGEVRGQIVQLMWQGEFDRLLLKPFPPLLNLLTGGFSPSAIGTLLIGGGTIAWTWVRSGAALTWSAFFLFLLFLGVGVMLSLSATILFSTLTVRWVDPMRLSEVLDKMFFFGYYPLDVYPLVWRTLFITVLPFSVAVYWPAQALLGRLDLSAWVAAGATLTIWVGVIWFWDRQLKQYTSAGG